ncbi:hypothetical protein [Sediminimonas qiaohouensis]|uniref:hypothetical protein n=1 Tax=Sediminimonas qiaohouensis TaxID=552061 RepID=UPI0012EEB66E|nr:hypothetical protein [Sediminimonas qiaohouensis]
MLTNAETSSSGSNEQGADPAKLQIMVALQDTPGPELPFVEQTFATAQFHQCGLSRQLTAK